MAIWDKLFKNENVESISKVLEAKIGKPLEHDISPLEDIALQRIMNWLKEHTSNIDYELRTTNGKSYIFLENVGWYLALHDNCSYLSAICTPYVTFSPKKRGTFVNHANRLNQEYGYDLFHVGSDYIFLCMLRSIDVSNPNVDKNLENIFCEMLGKILGFSNETYSAVRDGEGRLAGLIQAVKG